MIRNLKGMYCVPFQCITLLISACFRCFPATSDWHIPLQRMGGNVGLLKTVFLLFHLLSTALKLSGQVVATSAKKRRLYISEARPREDRTTKHILWICQYAVTPIQLWVNLPDRLSPLVLTSRPMGAPAGPLHSLG